METLDAPIGYGPMAVAFDNASGTLIAAWGESNSSDPGPRGLITIIDGVSYETVATVVAEGILSDIALGQNTLRAYVTSVQPFKIFVLGLAQ